MAPGPTEEGGSLNHVAPGKESYALTTILEGIPHYFSDISGAGGGTYLGRHHRAFEFARIEDLMTGKKMIWYVQVASDPDFIYRSAVGWGGDYIPGIRAVARMQARHMQENKTDNHKYDRMTAMVAFCLPGQAGQTIVFAGYRSDGDPYEPESVLALCSYVNSLPKPAVVPIR